MTFERIFPYPKHLCEVDEVMFVESFAHLMYERDIREVTAQVRDTRRVTSKHQQIHFHFIDNIFAFNIHNLLVDIDRLNSMVDVSRSENFCRQWLRDSNFKVNKHWKEGLARKEFKMKKVIKE